MTAARAIAIADAVDPVLAADARDLDTEVDDALSALRRRIADVVSGEAPATPGFATGVGPLDLALRHTGGVPRGRLTELLGAAGAGTTTLARRLVAQALASGAWVAYVDATRTLAPRDWAAVASGRPFDPTVPGDPTAERLWIVRPPDATRAAWCADVLLRSGGFGLVVLDGAPVLSRAVAMRLLQLARDADAALVLVGAGTRASDLSGALRLRLRLAGTAAGRPVGDRPGRDRPGRRERAPAPPPMADGRRRTMERHPAHGDHGGEGWDSSNGGGELCGRRGASPVCASRGSRSAPCGAPGRGRPRPRPWAHWTRRRRSWRSPSRCRPPPTRSTAGDGAASRRSAASGSGPGDRSREQAREQAGEQAPAVAEDPHWDAQPIAVAEGDAGPGRRLRVVSAAAGRLGVRAGMTVASARARCAVLQVWPWDEEAVSRAVDAVTALLLVASPQVTPVAGAPGLWWVGAGGLDGVGGERGLARALHRLARGWHPTARVGVADSCVAARAATWDYGPADPVPDPWAVPTPPSTAPHPAPHPAPPDPPPGCILVPRGGCAGYLARVPLALVQMDVEVRAGLAALGVRTAGGLAALASGDVEARWGPAGLSAWRLARGEDRRRPGLVRVEARRSVTAELAVATTTVEPVLFLVRAALDRLLADLARDALGAAAIGLTLHLDVGATRTVTREVRLPRPLARIGPLFERCRALLERSTLSAPVCGVTVSVPATGRLGSDQGDLLSTAWHDPAAVEAAFARLRAELGPNVVVRAVARDSHRPEHAGQWLPVEGVGDGPEPLPTATAPAAVGSTPLALAPSVHATVARASIALAPITQEPSHTPWSPTSPSRTIPPRYACSTPRSPRPCRPTRRAPRPPCTGASAPSP